MLKVLKFGGTSVANLLRLHTICEIIKCNRDQGHRIAVVVSAMAGITDQLVGYSKALCPNQNDRESDTVAAAGEQISAGLLALNLKKIGIFAKSHLGWQVPILTDGAHGNANILNINCDDILKTMHNGVPVIAGFQGINENKEITTLGRGGSDTTAVVLAHYLKADICEIYTDVDGVYSADPNVVPNAIHLPNLNYQQLTKATQVGAKVVKDTAAAIAEKYNVPLKILSSFCDHPVGTYVSISEKTEMQSNSFVIAVKNLDQVKAQLSFFSINIDEKKIKKIYEVLKNTPTFCAFNGLMLHHDGISCNIERIQSRLCQELMHKVVLEGLNEE